jgi:hypothetical protein
VNLSLDQIEFYKQYGVDLDKVDAWVKNFIRINAVNFLNNFGNKQVPYDMRGLRGLETHAATAILGAAGFGLYGEQKIYHKGKEPIMISDSKPDEFNYETAGIGEEEKSISVDRWYIVMPEEMHKIDFDMELDEYNSILLEGV